MLPPTTNLKKIFFLKRMKFEVFEVSSYNFVAVIFLLRDDSLRVPGRSDKHDFFP